MKIFNYKPEHADDIFAAIGDDPSWEMFTRGDAEDSYRRSLEKGVTYVCYEGSAFCGYLRALIDPCFAVYISELFVMPKWRNHNIGRSLIDRVKAEFSSLTVYALSDEDAYYQKIGHQKIGSVFRILLSDDK